MALLFGFAIYKEGTVFNQKEEGKFLQLRNEVIILSKIVQAVKYSTTGRKYCNKNFNILHISLEEGSQVN